MWLEQDISQLLPLASYHSLVLFCRSWAAQQKGCQVLCLWEELIWAIKLVSRHRQTDTSRSCSSGWIYLGIPPTPQQPFPQSRSFQDTGISDKKIQVSWPLCVPWRTNPLICIQKMVSPASGMRIFLYYKSSQQAQSLCLFRIWDRNGKVDGALWTGNLCFRRQYLPLFTCPQKALARFLPMYFSTAIVLVFKSICCAQDQQDVANDLIEVLPHFQTMDSPLTVLYVKSVFLQSTWEKGQWPD